MDTVVIANLIFYTLVSGGLGWFLVHILDNLKGDPWWAIFLIFGIMICFGTFVVLVLYFLGNGWYHITGGDFLIN